MSCVVFTWFSELQWAIASAEVLALPNEQGQTFKQSLAAWVSQCGVFINVVFVSIYHMFRYLLCNTHPLAPLKWYLKRKIFF